MNFAYTNLEGGVSIVYGASKEKIEEILGPLTADEYRAHIIERNIPSTAVNATEIDLALLPKNEDFRAAWTYDGQNFSHDLEKAKQLQLQRLRAMRDKLLVQYDGLQLRAQDLENHEELATIKAKKQALRDVTHALKELKPASIEDIKAATPSLEGF